MAIPIFAPWMNLVLKGSKDQTNYKAQVKRVVHLRDKLINVQLTPKTESSLRRSGRAERIESWKIWSLGQTPKISGVLWWWFCVSIFTWAGLTSEVVILMSHRFRRIGVRVRIMAEMPSPGGQGLTHRPMCKPPHPAMRQATERW